MKKLLKYWNQNRRKILIAISVIALLIVCIRIANETVKQRNSKKQANTNNINITQDITKPKDQIITDTKLPENKTNQNSELIQTFVKNCNQRNIEEAYSMLSNSCKQEIYSNINTFLENYINQIFKAQKTYKLELWSEYDGNTTYRITYMEGNALQTGGYNSANNFMDYITIVQENQESKLNISKLINKAEINKTETKEQISVTVNSRSVYMDYEIYNITIENATDKTILLNDGNMARNICILDENNNEYQSLIHEVPVNSLKIDAKNKITIRIKFNKTYNANNQMMYMKLQDIYLDKEQYELSTNKEELPKVTIQIKL